MEVPDLKHTVTAWERRLRCEEFDKEIPLNYFCKCFDIGENGHTDLENSIPVDDIDDDTLNDIVEFARKYIKRSDYEGARVEEEHGDSEDIYRVIVFRGVIGFITEDGEFEEAPPRFKVWLKIKWDTMVDGFKQQILKAGWFIDKKFLSPLVSHTIHNHEWKLHDFLVTYNKYLSRLDDRWRGYVGMHRLCTYCGERPADKKIPNPNSSFGERQTMWAICNECDYVMKEQMKEVFKHILEEEVKDAS